MSEPLPPATPSTPDDPQRQAAGSTGLLEKPDVREEPSPGDAERYAHYVKKEKITAAAVAGTPVVALCGKVWTPNRDPSKFPVCPVCKEIYEGIQSGGGDRSDGSGSSDGGRGSGSGFRGFFGFGRR